MSDDETTRLRALLEQTERERDDLAATLETRTAEHALAVEQIAAVTAERDALAPLVTEARRVLFWAEAVVDAWGIASSDGDGPNVDEVDAAIRTLADEAGDWTLAGPHTTHDALAKACDDAREERDVMRRERDAVTNRASFFAGLVSEVVRAVEPRDGETLGDEVRRVIRELAVRRAQQAPLVACVDALRAAARAAGWRDADATGETLVAWVRRGGACEGAVVVRDAAMSVADDLAGDVPEASDEEWAHELMHRVAAAVARVREGGE